MTAAPITPSPFDPAEALRFLAELGKDPDTTYFRTIRHGSGANKSRNGADLLGFDAAALKADNDAGDSIYVVIGNASSASGKRGNYLSYIYLACL